MKKFVISLMAELSGFPYHSPAYGFKFCIELK